MSAIAALQPAGFAPGPAAFAGQAAPAGALAADQMPLTLLGSELDLEALAELHSGPAATAAAAAATAQLGKRPLGEPLVTAGGTPWLPAPAAASCREMVGC